MRVRLVEMWRYYANEKKDVNKTHAHIPAINTLHDGNKVSGV